MPLSILFARLSIIGIRELNPETMFDSNSALSIIDLKLDIICSISSSDNFPKTYL